MVPTVALPPETPLTDQVTFGLLRPLTVAVNCCESPSRTGAPAGVTVTRIEPTGTTVKLTGKDVAPGVSGLVPVIGKTPRAPSKVAGTVAVRCCVSTNAVLSTTPLKFA